MFKAAEQTDPKNVAAIVNLGCIEYEEYSHFEDAAIRFLDALEIKPDDEEALCNLALALKRTSYLDYAQIAFEEAVNVSPGNTFILTNYMMFLLEQKNFEQFNKVMPHARRVMDKQEFDMITKLHDEFKEAIEGTAGKTIPEDSNVSTPAAQQTGGIPQVRSALKQVLAKRLQGIGSTGKGAQMQEITEEDEV